MAMSNELEIAFQSGFQKEAQESTNRERAGRIGAATGAGAGGIGGAGLGYTLGEMPEEYVEAISDTTSKAAKGSNMSKIRKLLTRAGAETDKVLSRLGPYRGALAGLAGGAALGGAALGGGSYLAGAGVDALQNE